MGGQTKINPISRLIIAESSPSYLLSKTHFWKNQIGICIAFLIGFVTLFLLAPYTYIYADRWILATIAIQSLIIWAFASAAKGLATFEIEEAIIIEIEHRGAEFLKRLKDNSELATDLDTLQQITLPNNTSKPPPSMIRLFQDICAQAKDHFFEPRNSIIEPYLEEALEYTDRLQALQKLVLWLSVLVSIVTLFFGMRDISFNAFDTQDIFLHLIRGASAFLFVSLTHLIAGLEAAVIIGFFILVLRKRQRAYLQSMKSSVAFMLSLVRNVHITNGSLVDSKQFGGHESPKSYYETTNFNQDVFLSYASSDREEANILYGAILDAGGKVFLAEKSLQPGEDFAEEIREALRKSRELWVLVSPNSLKSDWVLTELGAAWVLDKKIIPILYRCHPEQLPDHLKRRQCVDFHRFSDLVKRAFSAS